VAVVYPNGGEPHVAGTNDAILWNSTGVSGSVKIEYSCEGGAPGTWIPIYPSTENDGFAVWTVQGPPSTQARIRSGPQAGPDLLHVGHPQRSVR
jgi:hypothetical protein